MVDGQLTIRSACLDLETCNWTNEGRQNSEEMYYALNLPQTAHNIDRLHIKAGIALDDGTIAVVARGRVAPGAAFPRRPRGGRTSGPGRPAR